MLQTLKAVYQNGAFIPQTECNLPEGTEVDISVTSQIISPQLADISARQNFLKLLVKRMQENPIPTNAPHFTRDMLHERS
jgi:predicted DNA-binding antitoxin AbrB/MazE fold protein